jgi:type II secretory pathway component PulF
MRETLLPETRLSSREDKAEKRRQYMYEYRNSPEGKAKRAEAMKRYLATEKGQAARKRAIKMQALRRQEESGSFERKVDREMYRVTNYIVPMLQRMTPVDRAEYLQRADEDNKALREALRRVGY